MFTRGTLGQILPPPLVDGITDEELLEWLREDISDEMYNVLLTDFGEDVVKDTAVSWFSRDRLLALLDGAVRPDTDEERELVRLVRDEGEPVSLLTLDLEEYDEQGFSPTMCRGKGGWTFTVNDYTSDAFESAIEAARGYSDFINARF